MNLTMEQIATGTTLCIVIALSRNFTKRNAYATRQACLDELGVQESMKQVICFYCSGSLDACMFHNAMSFDIAALIAFGVASQFKG